MFIPISREELNEQKRVFVDFFTTQATPSYPSPSSDGSLIDLAIKNQVNQYRDLVTMLGEDFFKHSSDPRLSDAAGFTYMREMSIAEFTQDVVEVEIDEK
jgi:hypothetical protein